VFRLEGGMFTRDLTDSWIRFNRTSEVDPIRLRPTPHEIALLRRLT
jgi:glutamine synthetase